MLYCLLVIGLAFIWLLIETNGLKIQINVKHKTYLLPAAKPILMLPSPMNIHEAHSMGEWDNYRKDYAYTLEQEQIKYAKQRAEIRRHYCPICKAHFEVYVKTRTFTIGNSTFTLTGCPECITERINEVEKIQTEKHKVKMIEPHYDNPSGKRFQDWDESEYPHTIELSINEKTISFNGDYKPGCIKSFCKANKA